MNALLALCLLALQPATLWSRSVDARSQPRSEHSSKSESESWESQEIEASAPATAPRDNIPDFLLPLIKQGFSAERHPKKVIQARPFSKERPTWPHLNPRKKHMVEITPLRTKGRDGKPLAYILSPAKPGSRRPKRPGRHHGDHKHKNHAARHRPKKPIKSIDGHEQQLRERESIVSDENKNIVTNEESKDVFQDKSSDEKDESVYNEQSQSDSSSDGRSYSNESESDENSQDSDENYNKSITSRSYESTSDSRDTDISSSTQESEPEDNSESNFSKENSGDSDYIQDNSNQQSNESSQSGESAENSINFSDPSSSQSQNENKDRDSIEEEHKKSSLVKEKEENIKENENINNQPEERNYMSLLKAIDQPVSNILGDSSDAENNNTYSFQVNEGINDEDTQDENSVQDNDVAQIKPRQKQNDANDYENVQDKNRQEKMEKDNGNNEKIKYAKDNTENKDGQDTERVVNKDGSKAETNLQENITTRDKLETESRRYLNDLQGKPQLEHGLMNEDYDQNDKYKQYTSKMQDNDATLEKPRDHVNNYPSFHLDEQSQDATNNKNISQYPVDTQNEEENDFNTESDDLDLLLRNNQKLKENNHKLKSVRTEHKHSDYHTGDKQKTIKKYIYERRGDFKNNYGEPTSENESDRKYQKNPGANEEESLAESNLVTEKDLRKHDGGEVLEENNDQIKLYDKNKMKSKIIKTLASLEALHAEIKYIKHVLNELEQQNSNYVGQDMEIESTAPSKNIESTEKPSSAIENIQSTPNELQLNKSYIGFDVESVTEPKNIETTVSLIETIQSILHNLQHDIRHPSFDVESTTEHQNAETRPSPTPLLTEIEYIQSILNTLQRRSEADRIESTTEAKNIGTTEVAIPRNTDIDSTLNELQQNRSHIHHKFKSSTGSENIETPAKLVSLIAEIDYLKSRLNKLHNIDKYSDDSVETMTEYKNIDTIPIPIPRHTNTELIKSIHDELQTVTHQSGYQQKDILITHKDSANKPCDPKGSDVIELLQSSIGEPECKLSHCESYGDKHERLHEHKSYSLSFLFNK